MLVNGIYEEKSDKKWIRGNENISDSHKIKNKYNLMMKYYEIIQYYDNNYK